MKNESNIGTDIYTGAEAQANKFNLIFLLCLTAMGGVAIILNFLKIFTVEMKAMVSIISLAVSCFLVPLLIYFIHDIILKKTPSVLEWKKFKLIIIALSFLGIMLISIALSLHAVLLIVVPALMAGQYRYDRKLTIIVMAATILMIPIAVYGSFFLGIPDRNFIKGAIDDAEAASVIKRFEIATTKRMLELFTHYTMPRLMGAVAVDILLFGIAKRNKRLLDGQIELAGVAQSEMERRNSMQRHVIEDLAGVIETRDVGTGEHVIRTKRYVGIIARELQKYDKYKDVLTDEKIANIEDASPLHDVGKIAISDTILLKPGRFTPEEYEIMKQHSSKGGEMIENIFANLDDKEFLDKAYNIAMFHHEKWDGTGYPQGRKGEDIPIEARLMAIADVYDALVSRRVYKESMPAKEAFKVIVDSAGTHFDPNIIKIITPLEDEFVKAAHEPIERNKK